MFDTCSGDRNRTSQQAHGPGGGQAGVPSGIGGSGGADRGGRGSRSAYSGTRRSRADGAVGAPTGRVSGGGSEPPGLTEAGRTLEWIVEVIAGWLALLDAEATPPAGLEWLVGLAAQVSKAADGLVTLWSPWVVDRDTAPRGQPDAVERIARHTGRSRADVRRRTTLGRKLEDAPEVRRRLVDGRLSRDQAAPIADTVAAATRAGDPDAARRTERDLLGLAERGASVSEIADQAHRRRQAFENTLARRRRQWADRSWTTRRHPDGSWCGTLKLPVELGAIADGLISKATGRVFHQRRKQGRRDPWEAYAAEAVLGLLARGAHNSNIPIPRLGADGTVIHGHDPVGGTGGASGTRGRGTPGTAGVPGEGTPGTATGPGTAPQASLLAEDHSDDHTETDGLSLTPDGVPDPQNPWGLRLPDPAEPWGDPLDWVALLGSRAVTLDMLIRVDLAALRRGHVIEGEACEIAGVGPVDVSVAQQLLGRALLNLVITDGIDVQTAVVAGRRPTKAMWLALLAGGDPRCARCGARFNLELDHTRPFAVTRHTTTGELEWLCTRCHDTKSAEEAPETIAAGRAWAQAQREGRIPSGAATGSADRPPGTTRRDPRRPRRPGPRDGTLSGADDPP